ncbi:hypothetical protein ATCC90586_009603 [Pythium insidiosum]|nr:hypothetical protein ATCC90586_009603 [Pythium insidiosum]
MELVARSVAWATDARVWRAVADCALAIGSHRWSRAVRNALLWLWAALVGDDFIDERAEYSKQRLIKNDVYRDRLLAQEIAQLVDLSDALQLSIAQRKAFFRCFLHLDFMRRSGVSRAELLRYCDLRFAPVAAFLLPSTGAYAVSESAHRNDEFRTQRWDVVQLLCVCFSLCTMHTTSMVRLCLDEAKRSIGAASQSDDDGETADRAAPGDQHTEPQPEPTLVDTIEAMMAFFYGCLSPIERQFVRYLRVVCDPASLVLASLDVASIEDVACLFPVLVFPCIWLQRVVRVRVLGEVTWAKLTERRRQLEACGLSPTDVTPTSIVAAASVRVRSKRLKWISLQRAALESNASTPRKVVPVASSSDNGLPGADRSGLENMTQYRTVEAAWRRTADSALAIAYVMHVQAESATALSINQLQQVFEDTRAELHQRALSVSTAEVIRKNLIREYGYQFASFLFAQSSMAEAGGELLTGSAHSHKQERRAKARYAKAYRGEQLREDKRVYWKEVTSSVADEVNTSTND